VGKTTIKDFKPVGFVLHYSISKHETQHCWYVVRVSVGAGTDALPL